MNLTWNPIIPSGALPPWLRGDGDDDEAEDVSLLLS